MTSFTTRHIVSIQTIGERLQKAREGASLTRASVAQVVCIRAEYLAAIEEGRYSELPGDVYTMEYIKKYARFLRIDPIAANESYRLERLRSTRAIARASVVDRVYVVFARMVQRAQNVRAVIVASSILALVVVSGALVTTHVLVAPHIEIIVPKEAYTSADPSFIVQGTVKNTHAVYFNNEPLVINENGSFTIPLVVPEGSHIFAITAQGIFGKTVTKYISVRIGEQAVF